MDKEIFNTFLERRQQYAELLNSASAEEIKDFVYASDSINFIYEKMSKAIDEIRAHLPLSMAAWRTLKFEITEKVNKAEDDLAKLLFLFEKDDSVAKSFFGNIAPIKTKQEFIENCLLSENEEEFLKLQFINTKNKLIFEIATGGNLLWTTGYQIDFFKNFNESEKDSLREIMELKDSKKLVEFLSSKDRFFSYEANLKSRKKVLLYQVVVKKAE